MEALFTVLQNPVAVVGIAIVIFVVRVFYLAKTLKSRSRAPTLADLRALEEAKESLHLHRESLDLAKGTLTGNLEGARNTLRHYKVPYDRSIEERHAKIEASVRGLGKYGEGLKKARNEQEASLTRAKRLYRTALWEQEAALRRGKRVYKSAPRGKGRHAPRDM